MRKGVFNSSAKSFNSGQPAQSAQADLGQTFLLSVNFLYVKRRSRQLIGKMDFMDQLLVYNFPCIMIYGNALKPLLPEHRSCYTIFFVQKSSNKINPPPLFFFSPVAAFVLSIVPKVTPPRIFLSQQHEEFININNFKKRFLLKNPLIDLDRFFSPRCTNLFLS